MKDMDLRQIRGTSNSRKMEGKNIIITIYLRKRQKTNNKIKISQKRKIIIL